MSTLKADHADCAEEDEEDSLYEFIFDLNQATKEETESDQISYSCGHTPEQPTASLEQTTHAADCSKSINKDVENIPNVIQPNQKVQSLEEKPWRKSGADLSDYFNYGFDEQSWRQYCEKQFKLKAHMRRNDTKRNPARAEDKSHSHVSSDRSFIQVSRKSEDKANVSGGQTGCSRRDERQPHLTDAGNKSKATTKMSHKGDGHIQWDLPPPLPSSFRSGRPIPPRSAVLGRDQPKGYGRFSTSQRRSVFSKERNVSKRRAVTGITKDWKCFITQKAHGRGRDHAREKRCDKKNKASRDRKKQSSSSSHNSATADGSQLWYQIKEGLAPVERSKRRTEMLQNSAINATEEARQTKEREHTSEERSNEDTHSHKVKDKQKDLSVNKQFSFMPSEDVAAAGDRTMGVKTKDPKKETKAKM